MEVEEEAGDLGFIPTMNLGADEGFQADEANKKSMTMPVSPDAIGTMLREAITRAR